jgi:hypothetical protein
MSTIHWLGHNLPDDIAENILNYKHFWRVFLGKLTGTQPAKMFHTLVENGVSLRYATCP